ncbi:MAG: hypothetical protein V1740_00940 [Candidatus Woesearchaeota archaeon]
MKEKGINKVLFLNMVIDILPNLSKGDSVEHILNNGEKQQNVK